MSLSSLKRFLPAPPPRHVVLLSDAHFFVRSVPVTEGATAPEVAAQAELAVESLAPFPVAQLYYGHYWLPGATHALIYAAYRKRFNPDEVDTWANAEVVLPVFVTVLRNDAAPKPTTVILVPSATSLTGMYFGDASGVPTQFRVEPFPPEATEEQVNAVRDTILHSFPEKGTIIDVGAVTELDNASEQGEFVFRAGTIETHFTAADVAPLDVRDKDELAARRRAHKRDIILWRTFLGAIITIGLCALLEFALIGAGVWQNRRIALQARQTPVVDGIMTSQALATRIDELSTKRLLPFEMLATVNNARPRAIQFLRTSTNGLHTLEVDAQTGSSGDIDVFRSALNKLPTTQKAEVLDVRSRDGMSTFRVIVTFKPDSFQSVQDPNAPASPVEAAAAGTPSTSTKPTPTPRPTPAPGDDGMPPPPIPLGGTPPESAPVAIPNVPAPIAPPSSTAAPATTAPAPAVPSASSDQPAPPAATPQPEVQP